MASKYPLKSKTKLFNALAEYTSDDSYTRDQLKHRTICNETYGRKSCIYIHFESNEQALVTERHLDNLGFKVDSRYRRVNGNIVEVVVSYFKGHHWDE